MSSNNFFFIQLNLKKPIYVEKSVLQLKFIFKIVANGKTLNTTLNENSSQTVAKEKKNSVSCLKIIKYCLKISQQLSIPNGVWIKNKAELKFFFLLISTIMREIFKARYATAGRRVRKNARDHLSLKLFSPDFIPLTSWKGIVKNHKRTAL